MTANKKIVLLTDPKRKGHALPWGPHGEALGGHEAEGVGDNVAESFYCCFLKKEQVRWGKQVQDWVV